MICNVYVDIIPKIQHLYIWCAIARFCSRGTWCALDKSFPLGVFCRVYYSKLKVIRYVAGITTRDAGEITQRLYSRHAVIQVPRF